MEKSQEHGPLAKWLDRKSKRTGQKTTREEIGKGNQMTALRFQTGGDVRYPRPSVEGTETNKIHTRATFLHQSTLYTCVAQAHRNTWIMLFHVSPSCALLQQSSKIHSVISSQCIIYTLLVNLPNQLTKRNTDSWDQKISTAAEMTVTAISISHTGHRQKSEHHQQQQQQQQKQVSFSAAHTHTLYTHSYLVHPFVRVHPLVPCTPTRTLYPHSYLVHPLIHVHPLVRMHPLIPCASTCTLHNHLYLVPPLVPCTPTHTLYTHSYMCTHSYLVHPLVRMHPLIPCASTCTLHTHSYLVPPLVPCAPTCTLYTHSYLVHPLVPCTPTHTLYPHSYLVHPLVPCAPRCQTRAKEDQHSTQKGFPGGDARCVSSWSWQCGWQVCSHHHPSHEQQLQNRTPRNMTAHPGSTF